VRKSKKRQAAVPSSLFTETDDIQCKLKISSKEELTTAQYLINRCPDEKDGGERKQQHGGLMGRGKERRLGVCLKS
jgi:hypothetical protein